MLLSPALGFADSSPYSVQFMMSDGSVQFAEASRYRVGLNTPELSLVFPAAQAPKEVTGSTRSENPVSITSIRIENTDSSEEYLIIEFTEVIVVDYGVSGDTNGVAIEEMVMSYEAATFDYPDRRESYDCSTGTSCILSADSAEPGKISVLYTVQEDDHSSG